MWPLSTGAGEADLTPQGIVLHMNLQTGEESGASTDPHRLEQDITVVPCKVDKGQARTHRGEEVRQ
jgi:hypothetical protein